MARFKKNIVVLGSGLMGKFLVRELRSKGHLITVVDWEPNRLGAWRSREGVDIAVIDLEKNLPDLVPFLKKCDLVVGALPGWLGFRVLEAVIPHVPLIVDISFFEEDPFALSDLAKKHNCRVIVDMGLAPGINNLVVGYMSKQDAFDEGLICVGGLPKKRSGHFDYQAAFSIEDVIEEYTREARYLSNGKVEIKPALSEIESVMVPNVGPLDAFLTDGLRSLIQTSQIPNLKEKTMRYPGHAAAMKQLRDVGFFDPEPIVVDGQSVIPKRVSSKILTRAWETDRVGVDFAFMRVNLKSAKKAVCFELYDEAASVESDTAMARTTGLPCCFAVDWFVDHLDHTPPDVYVPEAVATYDGFFDSLMQFLKDRGVQINWS